MTTVALRGTPAPHRRSTGRGRRALRGAVGFAAVLLLGQILPSTLFAGQGLPTTTETAASLSRVLVGADTWAAVGETMVGWLIGCAIASACAIPVGFAIGRIETVRMALNFPVEFLRVIPPIILIPIVVLVQGPTLGMKITLAVISAVWPVLHQTVYGLRAVDRTLEDTSRVYRLSRRKHVFGVMLPAALPSIITGLRIGVTLGIMVVIVAEMVGGAPGIGREIYLAQSNGEYARMMAFLVLAGALGLAINGALRLLESRTLIWHPSQRGTA